MKQNKLKQFMQKEEEGLMNDLYAEELEEIKGLAFTAVKNQNIKQIEEDRSTTLKKKYDLLRTIEMMKDI